MITLLLFVYGLIIGSFLNALVWRLRKKRDWVRERSECTHCHHMLAAKDLVPVLSWLYLRGKCRYCHKKIDDSPLTELGLGLAFASSYLFWPFGLSGVGHLALFLTWLVVMSMFAVMAIYDFRWFLLPDKFTYGLVPVAVLFATLRYMLASPQPSLLSLLGGGVCFVLFYGLYQLSGGKWIGGGDVKLAMSLSLLAGSLGAGLLVIFASSLFGTLYALPQIIRKGTAQNIKVPYGPFLMLAAVVTVLFYPAFYAAFLQYAFSPGL